MRCPGPGRAAPAIATLVSLRPMRTHAATGDRLWSRDLLLAVLSYFLVACAFSLLMPTLPLFLSKELEVEPTHVGVVLSSYVLALLLVRPFSGYLVDRFPRKRMLLLTTLLFVLTFAGYLFAVTTGFFVAVRFVHGLFWGLSTVAANTVAIDIIPSARRAEGIGWFGVGMNLAMATAPYLGVTIYEEHGFPMLIGATLAMGLLSVAVIPFIRVAPRPCPVVRAPISLDRFILVKALPVLFSQVFVAFGWGTLVAFAVLYAGEQGLANAGIFFLFLAGGVVLSRVTSGRLVDRGHVHGLMAASMAMIAGGFFTFGLFPGMRMFCLSAAVIGLGYGTLFPALQTIYVNMAPASQRGTANATYLTGFDLGIGAGMLLGANLAEHHGYARMYLATGVLALVALVIYWTISRRVYERHRMDPGAGPGAMSA